MRGGNSTGNIFQGQSVQKVKISDKLKSLHYFDHCTHPKLNLFDKNIIFIFFITKNQKKLQNKV
jgi:hypothetical protein